MKYFWLRFCAYSLTVLAILVAMAGIAASVIIGINMTTMIAKIIVAMAGFILTAISATILVAMAQLMLLFMRVEKEVIELAEGLRLKTGD